MKENKEVKMLSPKLDVVFQALFGEVGSERITKGFLESILKKKIEKIDLNKNPILRREFKNDKLGVLDILAELDGKEQCNIELQIVDKINIIDRILYYWSRMYSKQLNKGDDYELLEKAIVILITNFEIKELKELEYHSSWKIIEENKRKIILTNKLEIHIIELPKIIKEENKEDELLDWLYFLENPKSERVEEKMRENENLKEARKKLVGLSEDERMQRISDLREKAIMDEKAIYAKGIEDGKEEGIEKGRIQGEKNKQIEIAKKMLRKNARIEDIVEITDISMEEVINIKKCLDV